MIETILFSLVPGGLVLWAARKIGQRQPPDRAARLVLYFLLAVLCLLLLSQFSVVLTGVQPVGGLLMVMTVPLTATLIPIIVVHWYTTPSLHTRAVTLLISGMAVAVLFVIAYTRLNRDFFMPLLIANGVLMMALVWQAVQGGRWWRWLGRGVLGIILVATCVKLFIQNGILITWPLWLQNALELTSWMLWPTVAVVLIGVIAHRLIAPRPVKPWRVLVGLVVVGFVVALTSALVNEGSTLDRAVDGLILAAMIWILGTIAVVVGLLLLWKGYWRSAMTYVGLIAAALVVASPGFIAATRLPPDKIVEGRAAFIDQAIQDFYRANGYYPANLNDLIPLNLLYIPNPLLFRQQTWCYEGGSDYYRFGYIHRFAFGVPKEYITIHIQGSTGAFPGESWVCDAQLADYHNGSGTHFP